MAFWHPRPARHYAPAPPLTDAQLRRALAAEVEGVPTFEAVLQLIAVLENECNNSAAATVNNPGVCASEVGGAETLRELRDKLIELRAQGRRDD